MVFYVKLNRETGWEVSFFQTYGAFSPKKSPPVGRASPGGLFYSHKSFHVQWAKLDLNQRPSDYESDALTN